MGLKYKRILAREFLFSLSVLVLGIASFLGVYVYNAIQESQVKKMSSEINSASAVSDSLSFPFNEKMKNRKWLFDEWSKHIDLSNDDRYNTSEKLWKRCEFLTAHDSIQYRWQNVWDENLVSIFEGMGFSNPDEFDAFIRDNQISNTDSNNLMVADSLNKSLLNIEAKRSTTIEAMLSPVEQQGFALRFMLISALVLFGLRYIVYGVFWSLKVLNE